MIILGIIFFWLVSIGVTMLFAMKEKQKEFDKSPIFQYIKNLEDRVKILEMEVKFNQKSSRENYQELYDSLIIIEKYVKNHLDNTNIIK
jgi:hypothetical protein